MAVRAVFSALPAPLNPAAPYVGEFFAGVGGQSTQEQIVDRGEDRVSTFEYGR